MCEQAEKFIALMKKTIIKNQEALKASYQVTEVITKSNYLKEIIRPDTVKEIFQVPLSNNMISRHNGDTSADIEK